MSFTTLIVFLLGLQLRKIQGNEEYELNCKPKPGCDFSRCYQIPASFFRSTGFNPAAYMRKNPYPITCKPNKNILDGVRGPKGEKGDAGSPGSENTFQEARSLVGRTSGPICSQCSKGAVGPPGPPGPPGISEPAGTTSMSERDKEVAERVAMQDQIIASLKKRIERLESFYPKDCSGVRLSDKFSGVSYGFYEVYPGSLAESVEVFCDITDDGRRWTIFQRREDGSEDFNRGWDDYVNGFGNNRREFWLGLENIHKMTSSGEYELRIDFTDWENKKTFANYGEFVVGDSSTNYRIKVGKYTGTAGDSLSFNDGHSFSTKDSDNDGYEQSNCAGGREGGWWYSSCGFSKLNGVYYRGGVVTSRYSDGVVWYHLKDDLKYSVKFVEMKLGKKPE